MDGATVLGMNALINIGLSLICIVFSWRVLINIRLEDWLRVKKPVHAKLLLILLSIVFGHQLATFFIDYLGWSRLVSQMFM